MRTWPLLILALLHAACVCPEESLPLEDCPELPFAPEECAEVYPGSHMVLTLECAGPIYGFRLGRAECSAGTVEVWCEL